MKFMYLLIFSLSGMFLSSAWANDFISKEEAHRLVKKEKALLLDVRTQMEYSVKHIDGAKHIPLSEVDKKLEAIEKLVGGKDKPIVVYCMSGGRSENAKKKLEKAGFTKVFNLGGIMRWY